MSACDEGETCRWATIEVWLHMPEVVAEDVPAVTTDRQVCFRCGAARFVCALDGRIVGDAPPPAHVAA